MFRILLFNLKKKLSFMTNKKHAVCSLPYLFLYFGNVLRYFKLTYALYTSIHLSYIGGDIEFYINGSFVMIRMDNFWSITYQLF